MSPYLLLLNIRFDMILSFIESHDDALELGNFFFEVGFTLGVWVLKIKDV